MNLAVSGQVWILPLQFKMITELLNISSDSTVAAAESLRCYQIRARVRERVHSDGGRG